MKHRFLLRIGMVLALLGMTGLLAGCATERRERAEPPPDQLVVGFSQMEMTNPWRIAETISIQQAAEEAGASIVIRDAESSAEQQVTDCLELLSMPVDYLVLAPRLDEGYQRVFEAARDAGIPVILVDRETAGTPGLDYACCITADFAWEGKTCARILEEAFEGKRCQVVELTGTPGSFVAKVRSEAFAQEAADFREGLFSHAVNYHVSTRAAQYAFLQFVFPIVIMRQPPERSFDSTQHDWHIREKAA